MEDLTQLLESVRACQACWLMAENTRLSIPFFPIHPKPNAQFVFIGRDPSPQAATCVGVRGGRSVFINEVFYLVDEAGVPEELVYITDMCKCHWRTSRGTPMKGTESRPTKLGEDVAKICVHEWLFKEVEILQPNLIFSFGEELYGLLRERIERPNLSPEKLSERKDKSQLDAELYFVKNGPLTIKLGTFVSQLVPLRHPGNSSSLVRSDHADKRWQAHQKARDRAVNLLRAGCA